MMRTEVEQMAQRMEFALQENDSRDPWQECSQNYLDHMLRKCEEKLQYAVCGNDHGAVIKHATNVANYAMMLADNAARLQNRSRT